MDVNDKVSRVNTAAKRERIAPPEMIQSMPAAQRISVGRSGGSQAKLFEVQSSATGLGIYNCIEQVIDDDEWNIANQSDIFEPASEPDIWSATDWAIGAWCLHNDIRYVLENNAKTSADTDTPDMDPDWVEDPYAEVEVLNIDEVHNFDDSWALEKSYSSADYTRHGDKDYRAIEGHCAGGCTAWSATDWTIGDRCKYGYPTLNAYILTTNNKTSSDTTTPAADADWELDNDEPGVGNAWENYWELPANKLRVGAIILAQEVTDTDGNKRWAGSATGVDFMRQFFTECS